MLIKFFAVNIKLPEMAILLSNDLNAAKKMLLAQPDFLLTEFSCTTTPFGLQIPSLNCETFMEKP